MVNHLYNGKIGHHTKIEKSGPTGTYRSSLNLRQFDLLEHLYLVEKGLEGFAFGGFRVSLKNDRRKALVVAAFPVTSVHR